MEPSHRIGAALPAGRGLPPSHRRFMSGQSQSAILGSLLANSASHTRSFRKVSPHIVTLMSPCRMEFIPVTGMLEKLFINPIISPPRKETIQSLLRCAEEVFGKINTQSQFFQSFQTRPI